MLLRADEKLATKLKIVRHENKGLRDAIIHKKKAEIRKSYTSIWGSEDTHLHAVLSVSISGAEQVRLACFLREKLRCVHRRITTSYYGGITGLMSGYGENFGTFINI
jgi:hypothetical protein